MRRAAVTGGPSERAAELLSLASDSLTLQIAATGEQQHA